MGTPQSAKLMIESETGAPFVVSGSYDTSPQPLVTASQQTIGAVVLHVGPTPPANPTPTTIWYDTSGE